MTSRSAKKIQIQKRYDYSNIKKIDGDHPFKQKIPFSYVEYHVRRRKNGKVFYFNFDLAKEMGLVPNDHPEVITPDLEQALLETFSIVIINEYDLLNNTPIDPTEVYPNTYMATRYLQLQHPNKKGLTSGDGRSIWNGYYKGKGAIWDISSCGTGATCLSPATAANKKFYKTGDTNISYGCGYSDLIDGVSAAIFSEIFHLNGLKTERTLCVIEFPGSISINVRANKNLLRPSHMFNYLKQEDYGKLKAVVDTMIERQVKNRDWKNIPTDETGKYKYFLNQMVRIFARATAQFESDYIFCWLDWDGDNILMDGGIIDYGSVRQFGLFHHEYRYDDVERWSTTIKEQKNKAKYLIQSFAQLVDFLIHKKKKNIKMFANHACLKDFDEQFETELLSSLAFKIGFKKVDVELLIAKHKDKLKNFYKIFSVFERSKSPLGIQKVADGINQNAIYCMRDILRELPKCLVEKYSPIDETDFMQIIKSSYATKKCVKITEQKKRNIRDFQNQYIELIETVAKEKEKTAKSILKDVIKRSEVINRFGRVTGDSILYVAKKLMNEKKNMKSDELHKLIRDFIFSQIRDPDMIKKLNLETKNPHKTSKRPLERIFKIVDDLSEGI